MKLTKYEHACFIVEEQGDRIIVDPGNMTTLPTDITNIRAIILTHAHADHFDADNLAALRTANPNAQIFAAKELVETIPDAVEPARGHTYKVGPFSLQFYGALHEAIRPGMPQITNLGICINGLVAYPGDSYAQLGKRVRAILAPINAPWLHVRDAFAFVANSQADITIPTHDGLLSASGTQVYDFHLEAAAKETGSEYRRLNVGDSIEL